MAPELTERERFLLSVIFYLDESDSWYLDQAPLLLKRLETDFGYTRIDGLPDWKPQDSVP